MKTTKHLLGLSKKSSWIPVFWTVLIIYLSFKATSSTPKIDFLFADKLVHFCFYFGFVFLWCRYLFFGNKATIRNKIILVFTAIVMGILIELGQGFFTIDRQADVFDAAANAIGGISGIGIANIFFKKSDTE